MRGLAAFALVVSITSWGCSDKTPTSPDALKPTFTAALSPANEVPPITNAEASGRGDATITLNVTKDGAGNITSATANFVVNLTGFPAGTPFNIAHIHEGGTTCACPVVVNTSLAASEGTVANAAGSASFTKSNVAVTPEVAQRLISNPANFYFNVHSTLNPGGVARGVLVKTQG
jgi:CHRD domain